MHGRDEIKSQAGLRHISSMCTVVQHDKILNATVLLAVHLQLLSFLLLNVHAIQRVYVACVVL